MKNETIKEPFVNVVKRIRDDIEDKKLNSAIKEAVRLNYALYLCTKNYEFKCRGFQFIL